ncbi:MAG: hypothetical protein ACXVCX_15230 [Ktedonobacterales bacterium]
MATQIEHVEQDEQKRTRRPRPVHPPHITRNPSAHRIRQQSAVPIPAPTHTPAATSTATAAPTIALAALQLLVGYEWLLSGVDKLLYGSFPQQLSTLLHGTLAGNTLPGPFAAILRTLVMPNAALFGVLIESAETLAGTGLIVAGLVALLGPLAERRLHGPLASVYRTGLRLLHALLPVAALGTALLGLSFFLLDGAPAPWFARSVAYGGALDTGLFLAVASLIILFSQSRYRRAAR